MVPAWVQAFVTAALVPEDPVSQRTVALSFAAELNQLSPYLLFSSFLSSYSLSPKQPSSK